MLANGISIQSRSSIQPSIPNRVITVMTIGWHLRLYKIEARLRVRYARMRKLSFRRRVCKLAEQNGILGYSAGARYSGQKKGPNRDYQTFFKY